MPSLDALTDTELEERWRKLLDWADENDDNGGHVGFSKYYRESAYAIEKELKRRNETKIL